MAPVVMRRVDCGVRARRDIVMWLLVRRVEQSIVWKVFRWSGRVVRLAERRRIGAGTGGIHGVQRKVGVSVRRLRMRGRVWEGGVILRGPVTDGVFTRFHPREGC